MKITNTQFYINKINTIEFKNKSKNNQSTDFCASFKPNSFACDRDLLQIYFPNFCAKKPVDNELFRYSSLSSTKPSYEPLRCDYSNFDEFSKLYSEKINSQLMPVSKEDIEALIKRLKEKTGARDELIKEVLYKLTYYSGFSNLNRLQTIVDENKIYAFGPDYLEQKGTFNNSSNTPLNYILLPKMLLHQNSSADCYGYVLDDGLITYIDKCSKKDSLRESEVFNNIGNCIEQDKLVFLNLGGWDIKCSDNRYRSANLFCGSGFLEDIAKDVIERIRQGQNLDDILYSDNEDRIKKILGDEIKIVRVEIPPKESYETDDIYDNLKVPSFSKKDIKEAVVRYFSDYLVNTKRKCDVDEYLKYLDETTFVYSGESFANSMMQLNQEINKKITDKPVYIVPSSMKSFGYVAYVYSRVNNVDSDCFIRVLSKSQLENYKYKNNPKVILDDISASGETQAIKCSDMSAVYGESDIYFACIVASETALWGRNKQLINIQKFSDFPCVMDDPKKLPFLEMISAMGYNITASSCAFPYMTPDSNCDISDAILSKVVQRSDKSNAFLNSGAQKINSYKAQKNKRINHDRSQI